MCPFDNDLVEYCSVVIIFLALDCFEALQYIQLRAFFSSLLHAIIAHKHLPFFKIFSNFVHFCPNFQIFCPFLPFFWKILRMPLLSRIGPERSLFLPKHQSFDFIKASRKHYLILKVTDTHCLKLSIATPKYYHY